jgi:preprotein translocase subunit YajC
MLASALQQQQPQGGGFLFFLPLLFIFAIFYFLLILPQQRRQKKWRTMVDGLKNGDRVMTSGGIRGTIVALRDEYIQLRIPPDNLRLEVARSAVISMVAPEEAGKS